MGRGEVGLLDQPHVQVKPEGQHSERGEAHGIGDEQRNTGDTARAPRPIHPLMPAPPLMGERPVRARVDPGAKADAKEAEQP